MFLKGSNNQLSYASKTTQSKNTQFLFKEYLLNNIVQTKFGPFYKTNLNTCNENLKFGGSILKPATLAIHTDQNIGNIIDYVKSSLQKKIFVMIHPFYGSYCHKLSKYTLL